MNRLGVLRERLVRLQSGMVAFVRQAMENKETDIIDLQRAQLFSGIRSDGEDIRPYYTEDLRSNGGFFDSIDSAKKYADWKESMTYPKDMYRNTLAPNLYIAGVPNEGKFHSELGVEFGEDAMSIVGTTGYARMIMGKYAPETFGLTDASFETIREDIKDSIVLQVKEFLNG